MIMWITMSLPCDHPPPLTPTTETEAIGKIHLNLAHKIQEELHLSLKEFREQQRDIRKKVCLGTFLAKEQPTLILLRRCAIRIRIY